MIFCNETKGTFHEFHNVLAFQIATQNEIITCQASHGTPINNAVFPFFIVAKIGCSKVLNGMNGTIMEHRFTVRFFHSDVKSSDDFTAHFIFPAHVNATKQLLMIDCKAWDFIHFHLLFTC